ncbi:MAG: DNA recombination protein RmuC [Hyphomicrobiales bacterium]|jgi:DNA recombination protein RmuC|nr:DNA recombination protein RmuC [Hyphomicrobiales bacterium]
MSLMIDVILILIGIAALGILIWLGLTLRQAREDRLLETAAALERQRRLDEEMAAVKTLQAAVTGRIDMLTQSVGQRFDSLQNRVGDGLKENVKETTESLSKLNERLAVIDAAQKNLTSLTSEVLTLKDVLSNKQTRGAFGQGRMEAIIRDALPPNSFEFQATLKNGKRPDCVIHLPNDPRPLIIDAKFPLESITAFREAKTDEEKKLAIARVRNDVSTHLKDIADKYIVPGETQEMAIMFVPSESIYADLHEYFEDIIQKAQRARIMITSPSLLMMAVQMLQVIVKDSRMREQAFLVQSEVGKILDDVNRLSDRVGKLATHFGQAQTDIQNITTSTDKITRRAEKIATMELDDPAAITDSSDDKIVNLLQRERRD